MGERLRGAVRAVAVGGARTSDTAGVGVGPGVRAAALARTAGRAPVSCGECIFDMSGSMDSKEAKLLLAFDNSRLRFLGTFRVSSGECESTGLHSKCEQPGH